MSRLLKKQTENSYYQWRRAAAIRSVLPSIVLSVEQISQVAYRAGYEHPSQFQREFALTLGLSPRQFRSRFCK
jgi:AraC-like DNA-binding protein